MAFSFNNKEELDGFFKYGKSDLNPIYKPQLRNPTNQELSSAGRNVEGPDLEIFPVKEQIGQAFEPYGGVKPIDKKLTEFDLQDIPEARAQAQSSGVQLLSGLGRIGTKILSETAKIPGELYGLGDWASTGFDAAKFEETINNEWVKSIDNFAKETNDEILPVYKRRVVENGGLLRQVTSPEFWATEGADGIGFLISMMGPGLVTKSLKIPKMVSEGSKLLGLSAKSSLKVGKYADDIVAGGINTIVESTAEGIEAANSTKAALYDKKVKSLMATGQYNQQEASDLAAQYLETPEAKTIIGKAGANTTAANMAILLGPNILDQKWLFNGFNRAGKASKDINKKLFQTVEGLGVEGAEQVGKYTSKQLAKEGLVKAGIGIGKEGFYEEGTQFATSEYFKNRALGKDDRNVVEGILGTYMESLSDTDMQKSIFLGSALGGGMGSIGAVRGKKLEDKLLYGDSKKGTVGLSELFKNNFVNRYKTISDLTEKDDNGNSIYNEDGSPKIDLAKAKTWGSNVVNDEINKQMLEYYNSLGLTNPFDFAKMVHDFNYMMPFFQQEGGKEMLLQHINNLAEKDATYLKETLGIEPQSVQQIRQELLKKADKFEDIYYRVAQAHKIPNVEIENKDVKAFDEFNKSILDTKLSNELSQIFVADKIEETDGEIQTLSSKANRTSLEEPKLQKLIKAKEAFIENLEDLKKEAKELNDSNSIKESWIEYKNNLNKTKKDIIDEAVESAETSQDIEDITSAVESEEFEANNPPEVAEAIFGKINKKAKEETVNTAYTPKFPSKDRSTRLLKKKYSIKSYDELAEDYITAKKRVKDLQFNIQYYYQINDNKVSSDEKKSLGQIFKDAVKELNIIEETINEYNFSTADNSAIELNQYAESTITKTKQELHDKYEKELESLLKEEAIELHPTDDRIFIIRDAEYYNYAANAVDAINRDKDGNIVSITLLDKNFNQKTFTKEKIVDFISYYILAKELATYEEQLEEKIDLVKSKEAITDIVNEEVNIESKSEIYELHRLLDEAVEINSELNKLFNNTFAQYIELGFKKEEILQDPEIFEINQQKDIIERSIVDIKRKINKLKPNSFNIEKDKPVNKKIKVYESNIKENGTEIKLGNQVGIKEQIAQGESPNIRQQIEELQVPTEPVVPFAEERYAEAPATFVIDKTEFIKRIKELPIQDKNTEEFINLLSRVKTPKQLDNAIITNTISEDIQDVIAEVYEEANTSQNKKKATEEKEFDKQIDKLQSNPVDSEVESTIESSVNFTTIISEEDIEAKKTDIEKRRREELKNRVIYGKIPSIKDGEFRIIGDPSKAVYRINGITGKLQRLEEESGLWTKEGTHGKIELETAKRAGFEKLKENINAKYDAELVELEKSTPKSKEQQIAEIERKRQEELETTDLYQYDKNFKEFQTYGSTVKEAFDNLFEQVKNNPTNKKLSDFLDYINERLIPEDIRQDSDKNPLIQEYIDDNQKNIEKASKSTKSKISKINAKYDSELAALDKTVITEKSSVFHVNASQYAVKVVDKRRQVIGDKLPFANQFNWEVINNLPIGSELTAKIDPDHIVYIGGKPLKNSEVAPNQQLVSLFSEDGVEVGILYTQNEANKALFPIWRSEVQDKGEKKFKVIQKYKGDINTYVEIKDGDITIPAARNSLTDIERDYGKKLILGYVHGTTAGSIVRTPNKDIPEIRLGAKNKSGQIVIALPKGNGEYMAYGLVTRSLRQGEGVDYKNIPLAENNAFREVLDSLKGLQVGNIEGNEILIDKLHSFISLPTLISTNKKTGAPYIQFNPVHIKKKHLDAFKDIKGINSYLREGKKESDTGAYVVLVSKDIIDNLQLTKYDKGTPEAAIMDFLGEMKLQIDGSKLNQDDYYETVSKRTKTNLANDPVVNVSFFIQPITDEVQLTPKEVDTTVQKSKTKDISDVKREEELPSKELTEIKDNVTEVSNLEQTDGKPIKIEAPTKRSRTTLVRKPESKLRTGTGTYKVWNKEKELNWLSKQLPNIPVEVLSNISDLQQGLDSDVYGRFENSLDALGNPLSTIKLAENTKEGTAYHEAFHTVFWVGLNSRQRRSVLKDARSQYGEFSDDTLEEMLADDFISYVETEGTIEVKGNAIKNFFEKIYNWIKYNIFGQVEIKNLYYKINSGQYANLKPVKVNVSKLSSSLRPAIFEDRVNTLVANFSLAIDSYIDEHPELVNLTRTQLLKSIDTGETSSSIEYFLIQAYNNLYEDYESDPDSTWGKQMAVFLNETVKSITPEGRVLWGPIGKKALQKIASREGFKVHANQILEVQNANPDEEYEISEEETRSEGWQVDVKSQSGQMGLSNEVRKELSYIPLTGDKAIDDLGYQRYVDFDSVHATLMRELADLNRRDRVEKKLKELVTTTRPELLGIYNKFISEDPANEIFKTHLVNDFAKTHVDFKMAVQKNDGRVAIYSSNSTTIVNMIIDSWQSEFYSSGYFTPDGSVNVDKITPIINEILKAPTVVEKMKLFNDKFNLDLDSRVFDNISQDMLYLIGDLSKGDNIFETNTSKLKELAKLDAKYKTDLLESSFRNIEGKTVYSHILPSFTSKQIANMKYDFDTWYNYYSTDTFYKNSPLLNSILKDRSILDNLEYSMIDGSKYRGESTGTSYADFSDKQFLSMQINMFYNNGTKNYGWYQTPILSDSPEGVYIKLPKYKTSDALDKLVEVAKQEYERIKESHNNKLGVKNFDENANKFLFMTFLRRPDLEKSDAEIKQIIKDGLSKKFNDYWEFLQKNNIFDLSDNLGVTRELIPNYFKLKKEKRATLMEEELNEVKASMWNYFLNQVYAGSQIITLTTGDPAFYKSVTDYYKRAKEIVSPTMQMDSSAVYVLSEEEIENESSTAKTSTTIKEGVDFVFDQNPELSNIGTQEQYSQYLNKIFPNSKVRDIVYHGSPKTKLEKMEGISFWTNEGGNAYAYNIQRNEDNSEGFVTSAIVNIKNPYIHQEDINSRFATTTPKDLIIAAKSKNADGAIWRDVEDIGGRETQTVVFEPEQIHILGSKQDAEGFKKFVKSSTKKANQVITPGESYTTLYVNDVKIIGQIGKELFDTFTKTGDIFYAQTAAKYGYSNDKDGKFLEIEIEGKEYKFKSDLVNVADAQTFISPNRYRKVAVGYGRWNKQIQQTFGRMVSNKSLLPEDYQVAMQPYKPFVFGHIKQGNKVIPVQNKNSEAVLFPQLAKASPTLQKLYDIMQENNLDSVSFESVVKVGLSNAVKWEDLLNGIDIKDKIHTLDNSNYGLQQEVPVHYIDDSALFGTQIMKHIIANLDLAAYYNGITGLQLIERFQELISENVRVSYVGTRLELGLSGDVVDNKKLSEILQREILSRDLGEDIFEAAGLDANGEFNIHPADPLHSDRNEKLLNSIYKNRVTKQKIKGGSFVQASGIGFMDDLQMVTKKNPDGTIKSIDYVECMLPWSSRKHFEPFMDENGLIDINKVPSDLLDMIGYRIPTEDKYSMLPLRVVGFLPAQMGGVVMLPMEITTLAGSDFDVDKLYVMMPEFEISSDKQDIRKITDLETTEGRNNKLIDLMWDVLTNEKTFKQFIKPGGFSDLQKNSNIIYLVAEKVGKYSDIVNWSDKQINDAVESLIAKQGIDLTSPLSNARMFNRNMTGKKLVGIEANHNANHSILQFTNIELSKPIIIDGKIYKSLHDTHNINGELISNQLGQRLAAVVDNAKEPNAFKVNLNTYTADVDDFLTRLRVPTVQSFALLKQPIVVELTRLYYLHGGDFNAEETAIKEVADLLGIKVPDITKINDIDITLDDLISGLQEDLTSEGQKDMFVKFLLYKNRAKSLAKLINSMSSMTNGSGPTSSDNEIIIRAQREILLDENLVGVAELFSGEKYPLFKAFNDNGLIKPQEDLKKVFPLGNTNEDSWVNKTKLLLQNSIAKNKLSAKDLNKFNNFILSYISDGFELYDPKLQKYFVENFPAKYKETLEVNPELKEFRITKFIEFKQDDNFPFGRLEFNNTGALTNTLKDDLKDSWYQMFTDDNPETRKFALNLFRYSKYKEGFLFGPKTFTHLQPTKFFTSVEEGRVINKAWKKVFKAEDLGMNPKDSERVVKQFIRNNWKNTGFVPIVEETSKITFVEGKPSAVSVNIKDSKYKTDTGFVEFVKVPIQIVVGKKTKTDYVLMEKAYQTYNDNGTPIAAVYRPTNKLGKSAYLVETNRMMDNFSSILPENNIGKVADVDIRNLASSTVVEEANETFESEENIVSLQDINDINLLNILEKSKYSFLAPILKYNGTNLEVVDNTDIEGTYLLGKNKIEIGKHLLRSEELTETIAHEAIHAIIDWETTGTEKRKELEEKLVPFIEEIRNYFNNSKTGQNEHIRQLLRTFNKSLLNENGNFEEIITYAFTDKMFAVWLNSIPAEGIKNETKTFWGKLKDIILDILTPVVGKTKLDELNDILDSIFTTNPISVDTKTVNDILESFDLYEAVFTKLGITKENVKKMSPQELGELLNEEIC